MYPRRYKWMPPITWPSFIDGDKSESQGMTYCLPTVNYIRILLLPMVLFLTIECWEKEKDLPSKQSLQGNTFQRGRWEYNELMVKWVALSKDGFSGTLMKQINNITVFTSKLCYIGGNNWPLCKTKMILIRRRGDQTWYLACDCGVH